MNIVGVLIGIVVVSVITAPFLWLAGKWIVGGDKAKFNTRFGSASWEQ
jgi:hypothetical protein